MRILRLIFSLRRRWKRALSPFLADMMFVLPIETCHRADELAGGEDFDGNPGYHVADSRTIHGRERWSRQSTFSNRSGDRP
jgi:hypothetical protein